MIGALRREVLVIHDHDVELALELCDDRFVRADVRIPSDLGAARKAGGDCRSDGEKTEPTRRAIEFSVTHAKLLCD
jgi:hypothetical protein